MIRERLPLSLVQRLVVCVGSILILLIGLAGYLFINYFWPSHQTNELPVSKPARQLTYWHPPDSTQIPNTPEGDLIRYGRELIAHTAVYLGPRGSVRKISNGMNCQNCHLQAGKKIFGNNYSGVASTYPKYRARSGTTETIEKRINDCLERSLNGQPLEHGSRELTAMVRYITWVGHTVPKDSIPFGQGLVSLPLITRAADPARGKLVYTEHCKQCHGVDATGLKTENSAEWKYPPLAGPESYNSGAGLFRLTRFAAYVKANMPYGTTFENSVLTDEQAWDVAAYINSLPRPIKHFALDWPDISKKPMDHPFGPYADAFSEEQHKYGPYQDMTK